MLLTAIALIVCLVSAVVLFGATTYTSRLRPALVLASTALVSAAYAAVLVVRPIGALLPNVSVLVVALLLGSSLGFLIKGPPALISFCIAAAIADIVSFQIGATAKLSQDFQSGSDNLLQYLCLSLPVHDRLRPIIGIGDLVILSVVFFALHRLGHRGALTFAAPVTGLLLALVVGLVVGGVFAIPFIAATTVAYVWLADRRVRDA